MSPPNDETEEYEPLTLVFLVGGQAVLEEGTGDEADIIWASDDDDDFQDSTPNEFLTYDDAAFIIDYLIDEGIVDESEREDIDVEEESYEPADAAAITPATPSSS